MSNITKPETRYCPVCGTEIVPDPHKRGGSPQVYCGEKCKAAAAFARWYAVEEHRKQHSAKVNARQKEKRATDK